MVLVVDVEPEVSGQDPAPAAAVQGEKQKRAHLSDVAQLHEKLVLIGSREWFCS